MANKRKFREILLKMAYNSPLERNLNLVLRYAPIVKILRNLNEKSKNRLKVLEIGSGTIGVTRFYRGAVTGIDVETEKYKNPRLKFFKASAAFLPFKDNSFDVVISVDTLEHLTRKEQLRMVAEAYRVSKDLILLTYPIGFNKYHERILKTWKPSHLTKSLEEHLHGGTAQGNEVEIALKGRKYRCVMRYGTHPATAYYLNYLEQYAITRILSRTIFKILLPLLKIPKGTIRRYYFIKKLK